MPAQVGREFYIPEVLAAYKSVVESEKDLTARQKLSLQIRRNSLVRLFLSGPPANSAELLEELRELLLKPPQEYPASIIFCLVNNRNQPTFNYSFESAIGEDRLRVRFQSPRLWIERRKINHPIIQVREHLPPLMLIPDKTNYSISLIKRGAGRLKWAPDASETGSLSVRPDVDQETLWINGNSKYIYRGTFWDKDPDFPSQSTLTINSVGNLVPSLAALGSIEQLPSDKFRHNPI